MAGQGTIVHATPDRHELGTLDPGASLAYWFGVAGTGGSVFEVRMVFDEDLERLDERTLCVRGTTDVNGGAVVEDLGRPSLRRRGSKGNSPLPVARRPVGR